MWAKWSSKNKPVRSWGRRHGQTVNAWRAIDYGYVQTTDWWQTVELVKIARGAWFCSVCINATNTTRTPVSQAHSMIVVLDKLCHTRRVNLRWVPWTLTGLVSGIGELTYVVPISRSLGVMNIWFVAEKRDVYWGPTTEPSSPIKNGTWRHIRSFVKQLWCMILQMAKICVGIWSISGGNKKDCTTFSEIIQQQNQKPTLFWENRGRRYTKREFGRRKSEASLDNCIRSSDRGETRLSLDQLRSATTSTLHWICLQAHPISEVRTANMLSDPNQGFNLGT